MGDGAYHKDGGLILCTDSYSLQNVIYLINVLIIKYDFKCTLQKTSSKNYRIYFKKESMDNLRKIVSPFMLSSMLYKIHL